MVKTTFPLTCWIAVKYLIKNWIFFVPYLFLNAVLLVIGYLGIYFFIRLGLVGILGSKITAILAILFSFIYAHLYTALHIFAINELKNHFENPGYQLSFTHWNQKNLYFVGSTLQMMISWAFSALMFLCLILPYFFTTAYYFFSPVVIAFYANVSPEAYRENVIETVNQSKNIRLYLLFFPLLFFFAPFTFLGFLSYLEFNSLILIILAILVFLIYPIYRYTVSTIYFYYHWEKP